MTISEVPLDTLNRFAAEKLGANFSTCGWKLPSLSLAHEHICIEPMRHTQTSGVMDWETPHRCTCGAIWDSSPYQHQSFDLTSGEVMERLLWNDDYTVLFDREEIECTVTQKAWERGKRGGFILKIQSRELFARAVLEAFCLSEGFQVEEA